MDYLRDIFDAVERTIGPVGSILAFVVAGGVLLYFALRRS